MRVTQSMLSNNLLRNLNTSYGKMAKLQQQIESGSVINRPSDDPVRALKGMVNRVDLDKVTQYKRSITEANTWLDAADSSLGQVSESLQRVKELIVQAANDTNTAEDRQKIGTEIQQIRNQIQDLGNSKIGSNYIFSGAQIDQPLFKDGVLNPAITTGTNYDFKLNVFDGVSINVNTEAKTTFEQIDNFLNELNTMLNSGATGSELSDKLGIGASDGLNGLNEAVLTIQANVGARQNRLDLMANRLDDQVINATKRLSENEDTDYAKAITELTTADSIHTAALSVGSKIIQQTLVDFIR